MVDVQPIWKDQAIGPCGCGTCGLEGVLRAKPWRDGTRCVKRGCACPRCRGKRNRSQGLAKQRSAAKALGVPGGRRGRSNNEEAWADYFANEVKAGAQCGPVANWWRRVERQVLANEADHGDRHRPVRAVAMPSGWGSEGLVVVRLSTWREHIGPALDEYYGATS